MRSPISRLISATAALFASAFVVGCKDSGSNVVTPPPNPSITVTLGASSLSLAQGTNGTVAVAVARNDGYAGSVDLTVEGAPTGVTTTFTPSTIPAGSTTSSLAVAVAPTVAAGSYTLTVRGHGQSVADHTASLTLTVTAAGGFTLSISPANVSVQQGSSTAANVTIVRTGSFAGAVTLSVSGAPAGLTTVLTPVAVTGTTSSLEISAASVAPGTYTLTVHGTAAGSPDQAASLGVQVVGPGTGTSVTVEFCTDLPVWVGAQNDGGAWVQVSPSGSTNYRDYVFTVGTRGAVAVVMPVDGGLQTTVVYATASELFGLGQSSISDCLAGARGSKLLTGTVAGMTDANTASIALGDAQASIQGTVSPTFTLEGAPDIASDLVAIRQTLGVSGFTSDKLILRRGVFLPNGSAIPVLDFAAAEAVTPATATVTLVGVGADMPVVQSSFITGTLTEIGISTSFGVAAPTIYGVPTNRVTGEDVHRLMSFATTQDGAASRGSVAFSRFLNGGSVSLGPALALPTITTVSAAAPQRLRAQLAVQTEYSKALSIGFSQVTTTGATDRDVTLDISAAYLEGSPATWDLTIPDLSAAGYDATWGLRAGTQVSWMLMATDAASLLPFLGETGRDGATYMFASRTNAPATLMTSRATATHRPLARFPRVLPRR